MFQEAGLLRNLVNFSGFIFHPEKAFFYISPCARYEVVLGITKPAS